MRTIQSQESNIAQLTQTKLATASIHYMWHVGISWECCSCLIGVATSNKTGMLTYLSSSMCYLSVICGCQPPPPTICFPAAEKILSRHSCAGSCTLVALSLVTRYDHLHVHVYDGFLVRQKLGALLFPIDGFHGAWLHFRRARIGVCV